MKFKNSIKNCIWRNSHRTVIVLHHVTDHPSITKSSCKISTDDFVTLISDYGKFVSLPYILSHKRGKMLSITFDDGLKDFYDIGFPLLKRFCIPFTLFIVEDFIGKDGYMSSEEIAEILKSGLATLGSHGLSHVPLTKLSKESIEKELIISKNRLENRFGYPIDYFAFSHGQTNTQICSMTKDSGYSCAFGVNCQPLNFITMSNRFDLPRVNFDLENAQEIFRKIKNYKN